MLSSDRLLYLLIVAISALIGWGTNYIAIKMLFRPRRARRFLGLSWQGLIPKRRAQIAASIAETVERELVSHRDVEQVFQSPEMHRVFEQATNEQVDLFLTKLLGKIPLLGPLLKEGIGDQVKHHILQQLERAGPGLIEKLLDQAQSELDFRKIVRERIEAFDLDKLESMIYAISARELKMIEYLGGILGALVGAAQVLLIILTK